MTKTKPWNAQIPKNPKFNERKSLYRWVDWQSFQEADSFNDIIKEKWLTHSELTMLILQGIKPQLIQVR